MSGRKVAWTLKAFASLLGATFSAWRKDNAPKLAASLSFYTLFSLAPLLMITIGIASFFLGTEAAESQLLQQVPRMFGETSGKLITTIVRVGSGMHITATFIGSVAVLAGASAVFSDLQESLNLIWKAPPPTSRAAVHALRNHVLAVGMVFLLGVFLLVSLSLSTGITALGARLGRTPVLPGFFWPFLDFFISLSANMLICAIVYKVLPNVNIAWSDVTVGAALTAFLLTLGKSGIEFALGYMLLIPAYGPVGSVIVFLIWVYISTQIFFFGAEFTHAFAERYGSRIRRSKHPKTH